MLDRSQLSFAQHQKQEIEKFSELAEEWRKPDGQFKHINGFNHCRVQQILKQIYQHFSLTPDKSAPLKGLKILDIGCGAGLICEGLAQLGAEVTGIDASETNILVAKQAAEQFKLNINYKHTLAEDLINEDEYTRYDVVLNTEVIEHVWSQNQLIDTCAKLTQQDGLLVMATLNKTLRSFIVAIIGAEYVLKMLPKGTHDWRYFISPLQLKQRLETQHQFVHFTTEGVKFNPFNKCWRVSSDTSVNYLFYASRNSLHSE